MENQIITNQEPIAQETPVVEQPPVPQQKAKAPKETVRFLEYLGLIALFSLPVIGLIAMITFMFAPKKKSIKNYARAMTAWLVVRIVAVLVVFSIVLTIIGNLVLPSINKTLGMEFDSIGQVAGLVIDVVSENYSGVLETLQPKLIEMLGEKHAPLLEELAKKQYNDLLRQIVKRDYSTILADLEANKYPDLAATLGDNDYANLIAEVRAANNGEPSELFDQISGVIPSF